MKTALKRISFASAVSLLLCLAACIPSVNPLFTRETTVFREDLIGVWKEGPQDEDSWTFAKGEKENTYTVTVTDEESISTFEGRLVKLDDTLFLDLFPSGETMEQAKLADFYKISLIPGHLIMKVVLDQHLQMSFFEPDKLRKMLEEDPKALAHGFPQEGHPVITASTEDLQKFFKKHAKNAEFWGESSQLQKLVL